MLPESSLAALSAAREHPEFWGQGGLGAELLGSPGGVPSVPPQPALAGKSEPRVGSAGLAGLGRHLLGAERMFWTKTSQTLLFLLPGF